ncbi:MAG: AAA family ATPase, partial [Oceanospirillales bacterium]
LPSLADRAEDLELLINSLLARIPGAEGFSVTDAALRVLRQYSFPGNIRELRNILERGMLLADDKRIAVQHLPPECQQLNDEQTAVPSGGISLDDVIPLDQLERYYLQRISAKFKGDNRSLAERLGVSERTLYRKLSKLK